MMLVWLTVRDIRTDVILRPLDSAVDPLYVQLRLSEVCGDLYALLLSATLRRRRGLAPPASSIWIPWRPLPSAGSEGLRSFTCPCERTAVPTSCGVYDALESRRRKFPSAGSTRTTAPAVLASRRKGASTEGSAQVKTEEYVALGEAGYK